MLGIGHRTGPGTDLLGNILDREVSPEPGGSQVGT